MITQAEVHVEVDGNKQLKDIELLSVEYKVLFALKFQQWKGFQLFRIPSPSGLKLEWLDSSGIELEIKNN